MIFLTIVVLPALSSPLPHLSHCSLAAHNASYSIRIRISLSFNLAFRNIDNISKRRHTYGEEEVSGPRYSSERLLIT